jgi:hypothetical protein
MRNRTTEIEDRGKHPQMRITTPQNDLVLRYGIGEIEIMSYRAHKTLKFGARYDHYRISYTSRDNRAARRQTQGSVQKLRLERRMIPH